MVAIRMIVSNDCFLYAGKHSEIQHAGFCIIGIVFRGSWLSGSRILETLGLEFGKAQASNSGNKIDL